MSLIASVEAKTETQTLPGLKPGVVERFQEALAAAAQKAAGRANMITAIETGIGAMNLDFDQAGEGSFNVGGVKTEIDSGRSV